MHHYMCVSWQAPPTVLSETQYTVRGCFVRATHLTSVLGQLSEESSLILNLTQQIYFLGINWKCTVDKYQLRLHVKEYIFWPTLAGSVGNERHTQVHGRAQSQPRFRTHQSCDFVFLILSCCLCEVFHPLSRCISQPMANFLCFQEIDTLAHSWHFFT